MSSFREVMEQNCEPLQPIATSLPAKLGLLEDIEAVLFDVYGTLLISGSGDVGTSMQMSKADAVMASLSKMGSSVEVNSEEVLELFYDQIRVAHDAARKSGTAHPEIVVQEIWQSVFQKLKQQGILELSPDFDFKRFSVEFETRVNPVWPMPEFRPVLNDVSKRGQKLGIISNAQFFTPLLLEYFLEQSLDNAGFQDERCFFSYEYRMAKPGRELYEHAAKALQLERVDVSNILYVGNDMLNDILPASQVGMKTALFAGDQRSLRLREEDARTKDLQPDLIFRTLTDLLECLPR